MISRDSNNSRPVFLKRLVLQNYKSIASCDIQFQPFTALVGPNGAGKSNVLDSLRFVGDALRNSLEWAFRDRGGIQEVRRRSAGHPTHFGIRMELQLHDGREVVYAFKVGATVGGFTVQQEECDIWRKSEGVKSASCYRIQAGKLVKATQELPAAVESDRLYLGLISGLAEFRPVFDGLTRMGFYNLNPAAIRELQAADPADVLSRDGGNITSILHRIESADESIKRRIEEYLETVVPDIKGVGVKHLGPKETIEFRQAVVSKDPWRFLAANMSDGTLRVLGVLVALFQACLDLRRPIPLIGIEEPEIALHPAAASTLASALLEASKSTQVVITSHSPDLLDHEDIPSQSVLAVIADKGKTVIGPVDIASRKALHDRLYTPGELLRLQQLQPEPQSDIQQELFGVRQA